MERLMALIANYVVNFKSFEHVQFKGRMVSFDIVLDNGHSYFVELFAPNEKFDVMEDNWAVAVDYTFVDCGKSCRTATWINWAVQHYEAGCYPYVA